jgi:hypothetical protein
MYAKSIEHNDYCITISRRTQLGFYVYLFIILDSPVRGQLTNSAAIIALIAVNTAWSPIQTLTIETYPTVVR